MVYVNYNTEKRNNLPEKLAKEGPSARWTCTNIKKNMYYCTCNFLYTVREVRRNQIQFGVGTLNKMKNLDILEFEVRWNSMISQRNIFRPQL
jgi:hypothetical protein